MEVSQCLHLTSGIARRLRPPPARIAVARPGTVRAGTARPGVAHHGAVQPVAARRAAVRRVVVHLAPMRASRRAAELALRAVRKRPPAAVRQVPRADRSRAVARPPHRAPVVRLPARVAPPADGVKDLDRTIRVVRARVRTGPGRSTRARSGARPGTCALVRRLRGRLMRARVGTHPLVRARRLLSKPVPALPVRPIGRAPSSQPRTASPARRTTAMRSAFPSPRFPRASRQSSSTRRCAPSCAACPSSTPKPLVLT